MGNYLHVDPCYYVEYGFKRRKKKKGQENYREEEEEPEKLARSVGSRGVAALSRLSCRGGRCLVCRSGTLFSGLLEGLWRQQLLEKLLARLAGDTKDGA